MIKFGYNFYQLIVPVEITLIHPGMVVLEESPYFSGYLQFLSRRQFLSGITGKQEYG
jgi:hypothetical protein